MEIILKTDIKGLGYKNDTVNVKPGYARNYLIPQGFAIIANGSNKKMIEENIKQAAHKAEKLKADAEAIAEGIGETVLEIKAKVGDSGKIFGAVTTLQISDALKAKGFEVDRKKISFKSEVKMAGDYEAEIDLHKEVKKDVKFSVVAE
ncbi:LSU ribosomal protein L9P [Roseivirga pacifica]|uniref:Large ribosomal subunit protein bL9 n=1 Tax=Roseivirga pacifica TaxID=1267423 RepID=A0A1I0QXT5_9BACT|nr:50S ribosomal protein L9 [Roseivirga pacifica]MCO6357343.1 50S ribosomal protein L9 [Roseivirga pacifica]MCO6367943.1 50S ribosomal protein L9 [Roseivirga pacifica]MCO6369575.1 50S ribosomal protein L9 [Roseivirga pacifica]MCO6373429.1 50S ribosomal protein L9 [Roseivirga pacifica]MCO6377314.1 50S ribosomal protein L9 [Roseivirga pacifica]